MMLSMTIESLLAGDIDPSAFGVLRRDLEAFPHDEYAEIKQLFGGCLTICDLAVRFDQNTAERLSLDLLALHNTYQSKKPN